MLKQLKIILPLTMIMVGCLTYSTNNLPETAWINKGKKVLTGDKINLKIAVHDIYCADTSCSCVRAVANRKYDILVKILKKKYNINIKLTYFMDQYEFEKALKSGKYDGAISKPWLAERIALQKNYNYKRIVDIFDPTNNRWLWGSVIVNKDSKIKTLQDLNGKIVTIGEDDAYEKCNAAYQLFKDKKISPAEIRHKASCIENIGELLDKKVDAAVVSNYVFDADCAIDIAKREQFRFIGSTKKIPLTSVILDFNKVNNSVASRLQYALLDVSKKKIKGITGNGFTTPSLWRPKVLAK